MVDDGEVRIEDHALIGPGVTLISGSHPNDPMLRKDLWQYTDPVQVGKMPGSVGVRSCCRV